MIRFSKEEVLLAAEQFSYGIDCWSKLFTESRPVADDIEYSFEIEDGLFVYDLETKDRLQNGVFYETIKALYDFTAHGQWNKSNEFTEQGRLEMQSEIDFHFTEICRFDEVFTKGENANAHLIFMGLGSQNTEDFLCAQIGGKFILDILIAFSKATFARWKVASGPWSEFTLEDLSLLADLNIKTIRNAASSKGADRVIINEDGNVCYQEGIRWLKRKKSFSGPFFLDDEVQYGQYETISQLAYHCDSLLRRENVNLSEIIKGLNLSSEEGKALKQLMKSKIDNSLSLITPRLLMLLGKYLKTKDLEVFVVEGSKVIASTVAEYESTSLFKA